MSEGPVLFAVPKAGPDLEVVSELERLLDGAREGRIRSVIVIFDAGSTVDHVCVGTFDKFVMMGMVTRLSHLLQIRADEATERVP